MQAISLKMELRHLLLVVLCFTWLSTIVAQKFYPTKKPKGTIDYSDPTRINGELPMFRSLVIDENGQYAYVGGKSAVYKLKLAVGADAANTKQGTPSIKSTKPNFYDR